MQIASRIGIGVAAFVGAFFLLIPEQLLAIFGLDDPNVVALGTQLLRYLCVSGFFITVALTYTGGLQGTGDTRSPLYITLVSQVLVPLGLCGTLQSLGKLDAAGVWSAIVLGHFTRCSLSVLRFRQGKWRTSSWCDCRQPRIRLWHSAPACTGSLLHEMDCRQS